MGWVHKINNGISSNIYTEVPENYRVQSAIEALVTAERINEIIVEMVSGGEQKTYCAINEEVYIHENFKIEKDTLIIPEVFLSEAPRSLFKISLIYLDGTIRDITATNCDRPNPNILPEPRLIGFTNFNIKTSSYKELFYLTRNEYDSFRLRKLKKPGDSL